MLAKKINPIITITSQISRLVIVICFSIFIAKLIWWVITPLYSETYIEEEVLNKYENSIKYIINRAPFGTYVEPILASNSVIKDKIKLSGIYAAGKNSIAFFEVNSKPMVARINEEVADGFSLSNIKDAQVTLTKESQVINLSITSGSTEVNQVPNMPPPAPPVNAFNPNTPNVNNRNPRHHKAPSSENRNKVVEQFIKENVPAASDSGAVHKATESRAAINPMDKESRPNR